MPSTYNLIKTEQKALTINLNDPIYGTFAEIGAGQEVARNFFQAGAASATIAKTMSAYDKTYSDAIYGIEESGRYVCESRLYKMLDHEWDLLDERLRAIRPECTFFAFANTMSTINFNKTSKGQGWLGVKFQLTPYGEVNQIVIHVKMTDQDTKLQQDAIGIIGVNLIYAAFYYYDNPEHLVRSLLDGVKERATIDSLNINGKSFEYFDARLLSLYLVKHNMTEVAIFDVDKQSIHASEFLYKKSLMVVRGNFKPSTLVINDVTEKSFSQFLNEKSIKQADGEICAELTIDNLKDADGQIDEKDFLERTELLCAMKIKVIISNCTNHQMLINYMTDYKIQNLGLVIGILQLENIINEKYNQNQDGRLLVAFGELFTRNITIYAYPAKKRDGSILTASNLPIPKGIEFLYKYLLESKQIVEVENYKAELLNIYSENILSLIKDSNDEWKALVPPQVVNVIMEKNLFGYNQN
jgi:hypothetical protein